MTACSTRRCHRTLKTFGQREAGVQWATRSHLQAGWTRKSRREPGNENFKAVRTQPPRQRRLLCVYGRFTRDLSGHVEGSFRKRQLWLAVGTSPASPLGLERLAEHFVLQQRLHAGMKRGCLVMELIEF